jgi:allantoin racemase
MNSSTDIRPVRVWHQSITDLTTLPMYREATVALVAKYTSSDTTVDIHGVTPGTYPGRVAPIDALQYKWIQQLVNTQMVSAAIKAEEEGYDVMALTCYFDPGLLEARSVVDIPVVGIFESSLLVATTIGQSFGLVVINAFQARFMKELVKSYGFEHRIAAIVSIDPPLNELEIDGNIDAAALRDRVVIAAQKAIHAGADVIIPAENVLNALLMNSGKEIIADAPFVNGIASLFAHAEMMVNLSRRTALRTSRAGALARPDKVIVKHFQTIAGTQLLKT